MTGCFETDEHDGEGMTVKELLLIAARKGQETGTNTVTMDLSPSPEIFNEPLMITFSFGKEARNSMARLLNTFLEMEEDENG